VLTSPGHYDWEAEITVKEGEQFPVNAVLEPLE